MRTKLFALCAVVAVLIVGGGLWAFANSQARTTDCCYPGSPCCYPGSPCCDETCCSGCTECCSNCTAEACADCCDDPTCCVAPAAKPAAKSSCCADK